MKKKLKSSQNSFILLFLCAFAHNATAQFDKNDQHIDWYMGAGGNYFKPEWKDMQGFSDGYNKYYASSLTTPFVPMDGKFAPRLETGLCLGNSIDISVGYTFPTEYKMAATFQNGESREFKLVSSQTEMGFGMNIFHIGKAFFGLNMSALFVTGKMYSGYRYRNDFVSYGTEKRMNGIFSTNDTQLSGGAQVYFLARKNIAIMAQWQYVGVMREFILGKTDVLGMKDQLDGYGGQYSNHQYTQYYPRDYENMNNSYSYFVGSGALLRPSLYGNRFMLSVRYNLEIVKHSK
jgi:hypothetical protein